MIPKFILFVYNVRSRETASFIFYRIWSSENLWLFAFLFLLHFSLQKQIIVDPLAFSEERFRPSLEERLESIISGAALMADSSCTRDDRRERIVAECNSVRQALQDLLSEYMGNVSVVFFLFLSHAI